MKIFAAVIVFLASSLNLRAQATQVSQIGGTVQDATGFAIPDVVDPAFVTVAFLKNLLATINVAMLHLL